MKKIIKEKLKIKNKNKNKILEFKNTMTL